MHAEPTDVQKSINKYVMIGVALLVFTVITVAANLVHLAVPIAITVALIIAIIKASMVAAVFMHLSHEKQWIYGALLLTLVFFLVLMLFPILTVSDTYGSHTPTFTVHEAAGDHSGH
jgi:caa(3)-type oxidase subunit IV